MNGLTSLETGMPGACGPRGRCRPARCGASLLWPLAAFGVVALMVAVVAVPMMRRSDASPSQGPLLHTVTRGVFEHSIIEPGEIESASNVEVRCEVQSRNSTGTMILEIVPAGTVVQPGEFLIRFDSSALENERTQQLIICNSSKALVIQSQNVHETALIAKQEYLEGTFKQEEQAILGELFVAEENLRRAEEYARYSERLAARGFVTAVQVEADRFAVEKARKELETAQIKLQVLREFTRQRMLKQLDADIKTAEAKLRADENSHQLDLEKLALIEEQIEKCTVRAPVAGKVTYANRVDRRGSNEIIIEEGAIIRERQPVIRLPDMTRMQVAAKINESRIGFVKVGQPAIIRLDAYPEVTLTGEVIKVEEYPVPPGFFSGNIKQYATYVRIDDPLPDMRPGLSAQVQILVEKSPDALTVPVQAVIERNGGYYVLLHSPEGMQPRPIDIGSSNDEVVLVREGLAEGHQVVINPARYAARLDFPLPLNRPGDEQRELLAGGRGASASSGEARRGGRGAADQQSPPAGAPETAASRPSGAPQGAPRPTEMVRELFAQHDANEDGFLTQDELPEELRDRFPQLDANGDGKIDRAELISAMSRLVRTTGGAGLPQPPESGGAQ